MVLMQVNSLRDCSARNSLRATVWLGPPGTAYGNVRFWRKADIARTRYERRYSGDTTPNCAGATAITDAVSQVGIVSPEFHIAAMIDVRYRRKADIANVTKSGGLTILIL